MRRNFVSPSADCACHPACYLENLLCCKFKILSIFIICGSGGMADALDSGSNDY